MCVYCVFQKVNLSQNNTSSVYLFSYTCGAKQQIAQINLSKQETKQNVKANKITITVPCG